jgi:hypothetical protein
MREVFIRAVPRQELKHRPARPAPSEHGCYVVYALISIVREATLEYTTEVPIYHADGTYLAKVRGTRVYATKEGEAAGVAIRQLATTWVCTVAGRTAFEIHHQQGDAFRVQAELNTPTGYLVKVDDTPRPQLYSASGQVLRVGNISMVGNVFQNLRIGVWIRSDGSSIGIAVA